MQVCSGGQICDYMQAHPKSFEGFVDTERPFDHYLSVMRQRGQSARDDFLFLWMMRSSD